MGIVTATIASTMAENSTGTATTAETATTETVLDVNSIVTAMVVIAETWHPILTRAAAVLTVACTKVSTTSTSTTTTIWAPTLPMRAQTLLRSPWQLAYAVPMDSQCLRSVHALACEGILRLELHPQSCPLDAVLMFPIRLQPNQRRATHGLSLTARFPRKGEVPTVVNRVWITTFQGRTALPPLRFGVASSLPTHNYLKVSDASKKMVSSLSSFPPTRWHADNEQILTPHIIIPCSTERYRVCRTKD